MPVFDRARLLSLIAFAYAISVAAGSVIHLAMSGDSPTFRYGLLRTCLAASVGIIVGCGLWARFRWAWWVGLVAAMLHLVPMLYWIGFRVLLPSHFPATLYLLLSLQLAFVVLAANRLSYAQCSR